MSAMGTARRARLRGGLAWVGVAAVLAVLAVVVAWPELAWAQPTDSTVVESKSLFDYIKDGGVIGLFIIFCSIIGVALAIAFAFQIRRDVLVPPELLGQVDQLFEDEEYEEALQICEANPSFLSSVLTAGLSRMEEGYEAMDEAMDETGDLEATKLHQKVGYLQLIASISPMLGLFGTVYGMIATFTVIATSPVQPKPADLAGGISTALMTTFLGLLVAIPLTVVYVIYRNRVVNVVSEVGGITDELMSRFRTAR